MVKLCIFDLDGTIADTIEDLADATNYALSNHGMLTHDVEKYKYFVGNGIPKLIERASLSDDDKLNAMLLDDFKKYYNTHLTDKTKAYTGMSEVLHKLIDRGTQCAVMSNKADEFVGIILHKLYPDVKFLWYSGKRDDYPPKPDSTLLLKLINESGYDVKDCLYVGDSNVDIQTAKNAGIKSCGVLWGFRTKEELVGEGAEYIAEVPQDLLRYC
ncbi:MAG: HAD family hydrolase [Clostridia bacterium]|nr:HAD family hydrolase [Clostridia bacterium]